MSLPLFPMELYLFSNEGLNGSLELLIVHQPFPDLKESGKFLSRPLAGTPRNSPIQLHLSNPLVEFSPEKLPTGIEEQNDDDEVADNENNERTDHHRHYLPEIVAGDFECRRQASRCPREKNEAEAELHYAEELYHIFELIEFQVRFFD
nr:hypothetical protein Iba_chr05fCG1520 [Ipomoea batatas]